MTHNLGDKGDRHLEIRTLIRNTAYGIHFNLYITVGHPPIFSTPMIVQLSCTMPSPQGPVTPLQFQLSQL